MCRPTDSAEETATTEPSALRETITSSLSSSKISNSSSDGCISRVSSVISLSGTTPDELLFEALAITPVPDFSFSSWVALSAVSLLILSSCLAKFGWAPQNQSYAYRLKR
uniref:Uncharacterized protein n=1 Tax=Glossina brevipalpis TaxID=37001 RepID=A0A1A9X3A9_9MUSC